jgi:hypothetical protein
MLTFSVLPAAELKKRLMKKAPANKPLALVVMRAKKNSKHNLSIKLNKISARNHERIA